MQNASNATTVASAIATTFAKPGTPEFGVATPERPAPGSRVVLAFRRGDGSLLEEEGYGKYHIEITNDGQIWGHFEDGRILSLVKPEIFSTDPKQVGNELGAFLQHTQIHVMVGLFQIFDVTTGEAIDPGSFGAVGWNGNEVVLGAEAEQLKADPDAANITVGDIETNEEVTA